MPQPWAFHLLLALLNWNLVFFIKLLCIYSIISCMLQIWKPLNFLTVFFYCFQRALSDSSDQFETVDVDKIKSKSGNTNSSGDGVSDFLDSPTQPMDTAPSLGKISSCLTLEAQWYGSTRNRVITWKLHLIYWHETLFEYIDDDTNFEKNLCNFVVSTVAADVLAPLGARASADAVMTKLRSLIYLDRHLGLDSIWRWHLTSIGNPIVEIRRSYNRLIPTMGFPILVRRQLYIESGPWALFQYKDHLSRYGDSHDRLIFNMGPILLRWYLFIEMAPWCADALCVSVIVHASTFDYEEGFKYLCWKIIWNINSVFLK